MTLRTQQTLIGSFAGVCLLRIVAACFDGDAVGILIIAGLIGIPGALSIASLLGIHWCRRVLGVGCAIGFLIWSATGWIAPDGTVNYVALWVRWILMEALLLAVCVACFADASDSVGAISEDKD